MLSSSTRSGRPHRGQALLELAVLLPLLLALGLGAAQLGVILYTNVNVDGAARDAALATSANPITSQAYSYDSTANETSGGPGMTCSAASPGAGNPVCRAWATSQSSLSSLAVIVDCGEYDGGSCPTVSVSGDCPPASSWVTVQARATVPIFVPLVGGLLASGGAGGQRTVTDTVTMRVEPCGITTGR